MDYVQLKKDLAKMTEAAADAEGKLGTKFKDQKDFVISVRKKTKQYKEIFMNYCKTIIPIITMMILITSCGSPSADSKTKKILYDQEQLEKDIAMYQDTWLRFLNGETSVVNEERFQEDVVVVTSQGDLVGIEACKKLYMNFLTGFSINS